MKHYMYKSWEWCNTHGWMNKTKCATVSPFPMFSKDPHFFVSFFDIELIKPKMILILTVNYSDESEKKVKKLWKKQLFSNFHIEICQSVLY